MKKEYNLVAKITVTTFTTVEANSEEEAIQKGKERQSLMSVVSNNGDSEEDVWMVEELDGMPYDIKIEE